ncbi:rpL41-like protein [Phytophthora cinnamomi]|uniref:rpL41-like protein n=1 Tax=Phytophthora cinnamomi TaxID=4785 RepID=UPI003559BF47|nr:rpL41-like protein [Phytophthora cinnamomi]
MLEILESSYTCLWENSCPLAHNTTLGREIVLDYSPGEQALTFDLANGFASITFELDSDDGNWAYTFVEDFTANVAEVTTQLDSLLTEMYRSAFSNVATVQSALATTEDPDSAVVTAQLTIHYRFLGRLPQPFVTLNNSTLSSQPTIRSLVEPAAPLAAAKPHFLLTALLGTPFRHLSIQEGRMQLFVETLSGSPLTLSVAADASVASVKQAVEDVEYIQNFRLVCAGKQLSSGSLADYAVGECDTLKMLLDVNGGMRAKWRKKRMRRLRRKRRKMRQRAR